MEIYGKIIASAAGKCFVQQDDCSGTSLAT